MTGWTIFDNASEARTWIHARFGNPKLKRLAVMSKPVLFILTLLLMPLTAGSTLQQERAKKSLDQSVATPRHMIEPETSPIATVNGVEIPLEKFNQLYQARVSRLQARDSNIFPAIAVGIKAAIVLRLIDEMLVEQEAKRRRIVYSTNDANEAMSEFEKSFPSVAAFQNFLATAEGGEPALREQLRLQVLKERLAGISANEPVSEAEVRAFYDQNNERFNVPAHLTVQHIVFLVGANSAIDIDRAQKAKAEAALEQARRPNVSFASLARQQSEGPRAKAGGDLGQVTERSIDPVLWNQLSRMQPGEISGVIRTADGYHVLKLLRRNPEMRQSLEQAEREIKSMIRARRNSARLAELIATLRAKGKIENHLLRRYPLTMPNPAILPRREIRGSGLTAPGAIPVTLPPGPGPGTTRPNRIP